MRRLLRGVFLLAFISAGMRYLAGGRSSGSMVDWKSVTVEGIRPFATLAHIKAALGPPVDVKKFPSSTLVHYCLDHGVARLWGHHLELDGRLVARSRERKPGDLFMPPASGGGWRCTQGEIVRLLGVTDGFQRPPYLRDLPMLPETSPCLCWGRPGRPNANFLCLRAVFADDQSSMASDFSLEWLEPGEDVYLAFQSRYSSPELRREARRWAQ